MSVHLVYPLHGRAVQFVCIFISPAGAEFEGALHQVDEGLGDGPAPAQGYWVVEADVVAICSEEGH